MLPAPASPVPLWCGGYSGPALRRAAALCDGWIGVFPDADRGRQIVTALREQLDEHGRDPAGFRIVASVPALGSVEAVEEWAQLGVTDVIVQPWALSARGDSTERHVGGGAALDLPTMVSAVESFAARLAPAFREM
jgi:alkanesulfonate monooxygenase SsuD/methylene tetrahydromethanopterin reductase-like flavin-dependent oxidoreductase (luciferase family)